MKTIQVRVTGSDGHKWYRTHVGEVFAVNAEPHISGLHELAVDSSHERFGYGIKPEHFEVVLTDKFVEHEGVKYKVPGWATFLTRDGAHHNMVFAWENKPVWQGMNVSDRSGKGYQDPQGGRRTDVRPYVEPLPEGNFMKEI